jgi:hypothetical protein
VKHWKPDENIAAEMARENPVPVRKRWPAGATAGLLIVAASCVALGAVMYHVTGPRDVFKDEAPAD